jgi:RNA polymerase sigma-70 factor (ECF subfamily)
VEVLRARFIDDVVRRLPAVEQREEARAELAQELLFRLLAGDPPKLAEYSGRGPLGVWIRVVATRMALEVHRSEARHTPFDGAIADRVLSEEADPEIGYLKSKYLADFHSAFDEALAVLPRDERLLLRLAYVERVEMAALAKANRWHLATAYRRVAAARDRLFAETCRILRERLQLHPAELQSLIVLVRSQLQASIFSKLRETSG